MQHHAVQNLAKLTLSSVYITVDINPKHRWQNPCLCLIYTYFNLFHGIGIVLQTGIIRSKKNPRSRLIAVLLLNFFFDQNRFYLSSHNNTLDIFLLNNIDNTSNKYQ